MFGALKNILGTDRRSKSTAKSRLHFVLVQDRTGLTNDEMASFRKEILDVMEKYFVIDKQAFDIQYQRESDTTTLVINSPLVVNRKEAIGGQVGSRNGSKQGNNRKGKKAANTT